MGRAAEAGVVVALLARDGYEGPDTVLEGQYGYLESYCRDGDATQFTKDHGTHFDIVYACLKRYACHITAHTPVQSLQELRAEYGFNGDDVAALTIFARHKILSHHDIREPRDVAGAQYSVPFCAAIALYYDVNDPLAFSETALSDTKVRTLASRLKVAEMDHAEKGGAWATRVAVELKDGRRFERFVEEFKGTPAAPLSAVQRVDLVPALIQLVNESFEAEIRAGTFKPLTVQEVASYYKQGAQLWRVYLAARKADRFLHRLMGRTYRYILPEKIVR